MSRFALIAAIVLACRLGYAFAGDAEWRRYVIPSTGASIEMPVTIFSQDAGSAEGGIGRRFITADRRADLTVESVPNPENDSPAMFLEKKNPPAGIIYKRVTPTFFVACSTRNGRIWYNRCNRSTSSYMNCVLINYPSAEKRQWDRVVTRISHTLAN